MRFSIVSIIWIVSPFLGPPRTALAQTDTRLDLPGVWHAETYALRTGERHRVDGHIFFTERDWTVLFFVMDGAEPRRGSGEGGSYTLTGDSLVLSHRYHLSAGDGMPGLAASPLRMEVRGAAQATTEPTRVHRAGDRLTLFFPSGNSMTFRRR